MAEKDVNAFITCNGCDLHVLRSGQGAPILFLHGATGGGAWLPFMETLSADYEILAPDHPGFGHSSDPDWLDSVSDLAFFYLDLLKQLNLGPVHVVGTSLGGWIAAEMAVRDTRLIKSLTLVCAVGLCANGRPIDDIFRLSPDEHLRRFCHDETGMAARRKQLSDLDPLIRERNRAAVVRLCWEPRFHNPKLGRWLHRIDRPTQILWGASDEIVPLAFGEAYREYLPHAKLNVIPASGHAPFLEQPAIFVDHLKSFFGSL